MARLRLRGARRCHRSQHLGVSRGDLGVHPRCSDTSSAFEKERPLTRPVYLFGLRPLHLCGTRIEGGHQGLSRRYGGVEGEPLAWGRRRVRPVPEPRAMRKPLLIPGCRTPSSRLRFHWRGCEAADDAAALWLDHANLRVRESLRCPPSRRVPHKWSGRRPNKYTAAQRPFRYETRRTCLSSEGGHRRLCTATSEHRRLCASPLT